VRGDSSSVDVFFNGSRYYLSGVKRIRCELGAGDDQFENATRFPATISGGDGNDELLGGSGNDYFNGGAGTNTVSGGAGTDTADYSRRARELVIGIDNRAKDGEAGERDNVFDDIETVRAGDGNDYISGSSADNTFYGGAGRDTIVGGAGTDSAQRDSI